MKYLPTIYCYGRTTYAYVVGGVWFCARCGVRVKVVT